MKKNQWILGVVLLAFVALLVTASLLYGGLSQDNAPDNLIIEDHATTTATTTAATDGTTNGDTVQNPAVTDPAATTAPVDMTAPDFTVLDRDGNSVRLSDCFDQGKPIVINFWASWCGPCQSEMPDFEEAYLRYADDNASEELIETALEVSQAKEFVDRMPDRLNEPIAQGGTNVSGGQKQRLSIARALVKNAQVYIFDDSFSALDYATDARLREALNKLVEKTRSTVFIVAQRISTIRNADKIIVLDNGEITGIGTHDELMKTCRVYQEIAYSQLSEEELA